MADLFWDQPTDPSDRDATPGSPGAAGAAGTGGEAKPRRRRRDASGQGAGQRRAGEQGVASEASDAAATDTDAHLREALARVTYGDTGEWERALRDAGFSDTQARHLIFERLRPRDEGHVRRS